MQDIPLDMKDPLLDVFHVDGASEYFLELQTRNRKALRYKQHPRKVHQP